MQSKLQPSCGVLEGEFIVGIECGRMTVEGPSDWEGWISSGGGSTGSSLAAVHALCKAVASGGAGEGAILLLITPGVDTTPVKGGRSGEGALGFTGRDLDARGGSREEELELLVLCTSCSLWVLSNGAVLLCFFSRAMSELRPFFLRELLFFEDS